MFEEFIVGDLHALNLVDYATTTDFTHGGGGWWYADLMIPQEYMSSEKWYLWYHIYIGGSTTTGLRLGFIPTPAPYCRSFRVAHIYTTAGTTWYGTETYEPFYMHYDNGANSNQIVAGEVTFLKMGEASGRTHFLSNSSKWNAANGEYNYQINSGDLSQINFDNMTGLRISTSGLPTSGTPITGRVELYALSPRSLL